MKLANQVTLAAAALAASVAFAVAQPHDHESHHPAAQATAPMQQRAAPSGTNGMMGDDMAQMMTKMSMMRDGAMSTGMGPMGARRLQHIEGHIAFYKTELHITEAQLPQWNAFADALRASVARLQQALTPVSATGVTPAPEQLERRIALLSARLEAMQTVLAAAKPLYAVLTDEQKRTADEFLAEHMMVMPRSGE